MSTLAASSSIEETYGLLVSLLNRCPQSIEILPGDGSIWAQQDQNNTKSVPSFAPFLFVEENLGVPQRILYELYLHAAGVFNHNRALTRPAIMIQQHHDLEVSPVRALVASSSILLLANPSHQTALNARKHLVRMHMIDPHIELRFVASLLSSQHCAKHAELWYHRRWLLSAAYDSLFSHDAGMDPCCRLQFASQEAFQLELTLVSRACELYSRNYFAWTHRLICVRSLLSDYLSGTDSVGFVATFHREIVAVKGWIDRHVSDYSAIHFILTLSHVALQSGDVGLRNTIIDQDLSRHAISLVREYPTHEALWIYIRAAVSIVDSWQAGQTQQFISDFVQPLACSQQTKMSREEDSVKISQFATMFLDRKAGYGFYPGK